MGKFFEELEKCREYNICEDEITTKVFKDFDEYMKYTCMMEIGGNNILAIYKISQDDGCNNFEHIKSKCGYIIEREALNYMKQGEKVLMVCSDRDDNFSYTALSFKNPSTVTII